MTASKPMSSADPDSDPAWLLPSSSLATGSGGSCATDLLLCADSSECADSMGVSGPGREPVLPRLWADSVTLPGWKQLDHMLMKPSLQPARAHTDTHIHSRITTPLSAAVHRPCVPTWPQAGCCAVLACHGGWVAPCTGCLPLCGAARSSASDGGETTTSIDVARSSASTDWMIIASDGTCVSHTRQQHNMMLATTR
jgi:hypothetical protein